MEKVTFKMRKKKKTAHHSIRKLGAKSAVRSWTLVSRECRSVQFARMGKEKQEGMVGPMLLELDTGALPKNFRIAV